ncbi:hypothetical protein [uncultured Pseudokineococcus sp.]|uniref:hypothetical protein n=1 Tax=uncultured Pseudokineococcus sp. TaxID=1642928 RepID=UPI002638353F|nr:hypothetical protein [uncultured Pseudokineococcus sp.]
MSGDPSSPEPLPAEVRTAIERGRVVDSSRGAHLVAYVVGADERYGRPGRRCWAVVGPGDRVLLVDDDDELAARLHLPGACVR